MGGPARGQRFVGWSEAFCFLFFLAFGGFYVPQIPKTSKNTFIFFSGVLRGLGSWLLGVYEGFVEVSWVRKSV